MNQIGLDLIVPLKDIGGFRYVVTAVDYVIKFVKAEPLKEGMVRLELNSHTNYFVDMAFVIFILQTKVASQ